MTVEELKRLARVGTVAVVLEIARRVVFPNGLPDLGPLWGPDAPSQPSEPDGPPSRPGARGSGDSDRRSGPIPPGTAVHVIANPEGEFIRVDTVSPGSPFYGCHWDAVCRAFLGHGLVEGRVLAERWSRKRVFAGYRVRIGNVEGFLPNSLAREDLRNRLPLDLTLAVVGFDPGPPRVILGQAARARCEGDGADVRARLDACRAAGRPVRGRVVGRSLDPLGTPVGLLVDVDGIEVFIHADRAMGLTTLPEGALLGLPVLCLLHAWNERFLNFTAGIEDVFRRFIDTDVPPRPGDTVQGLGLVPEDGRIVVLLPGKALGSLEAADIPFLAHEDRREVCGILLPFAVGRRLPGERPARFQVRLAG